MIVISSTLKSRRIDQLPGGVDVGLHDRIGPGGGHHQIHRGAKAVGELFFKAEVCINKLGGFERLKFNQQVDVALASVCCHAVCWPPVSPP